jgi:ABC-type Zn2+ transport system substrate-binding protein/surface adhesin
VHSVQIGAHTDTQTHRNTHTHTHTHAHTHTHTRTHTHTHTHTQVVYNGPPITGCIDGWAARGVIKPLVDAVMGDEKPNVRLDAEKIKVRTCVCVCVCVCVY